MGLTDACLQIGQRRSLHELPQLKAHGLEFRENGIPSFLSLEAYTLAWFDYQSMLIEKLNQLTFGMILNLGRKVHHTADKTSLLRDRRRWHWCSRSRVQVRPRRLSRNTFQLRLYGREQSFLLRTPTSYGHGAFLELYDRYPRFVRLFGHPQDGDDRDGRRHVWQRLRLAVPRR
jgi:hypothetical protein